VRAARDARVVEIDRGRLAPGPWQPRRIFDADTLAELATSIRARGILSPLRVVINAAIKAARRTVRCGPMSTRLTRLTRNRAHIRSTSGMSCLLCGESAATLEGGTLRPSAAKSMRVTGARIICGRFGGSLSPTDQASSSISCERKIAEARRIES
jgi:hypothetical protein